MLPEHVPPMLCKIGKPFDSPAHWFEVKWDGVRAMTYVDERGLRMHGRKRRDLATRYPELRFLAGMPADTMLDGELVVLQPDGRPDFPSILRRENTPAERAAQAAQSQPVVYVVFDVLWAAGHRLLDEPLAVRRAALATVVQGVGHPRLIATDGTEGAGLTLFDAVRERGLEGIVAKRLDSRYRPGERTDAWQKIKAPSVVQCAILGYEPDGERDFKSLIVATDVDGVLTCVGRVGSGFDVATKNIVWQRLQRARCAQPLIDAGMPGRWVEPGLYCSVSYLERTANGQLRAPVFLQMLDG
jgi:bifunctional non-homologous end joining protein LigD